MVLILADLCRYVNSPLRGVLVVPRAGVEPTNLAASGPKPDVFANFTTSAKVYGLNIAENALHHNVSNNGWDAENNKANGKANNSVQ